MTWPNALFPLRMLSLVGGRDGEIHGDDGVNEVDDDVDGGETVKKRRRERRDGRKWWSCNPFLPL